VQQHLLPLPRRWSACGREMRVAVVVALLLLLLGVLYHPERQARLSLRRRHLVVLMGKRKVPWRGGLRWLAPLHSKTRTSVSLLQPIPQSL